MTCLHIYLKVAIALSNDDVVDARACNDEMKAMGGGIGAMWDRKAEMEARVCRVEGRLDEGLPQLTDARKRLVDFESIIDFK